MNTIGGYIRLARPVNMLICGLSVLCGGIIGDRPLTVLTGFIMAFGNDPPQLPLRLVAAIVSASLILAAGNVLNDIRDVAADRINAPHRPLPSGAVTGTGAAIYSTLLFLGGLVTALPLGFFGTATALTAALLLAVYDVRLKGVPLAGNLAVALLGGLAFVYGGIAGECTGRALIPASFAALFHLGREIIKDAADIRGDSSSSVRTAATAWGVHTAGRLAAAVFAALAAVVVLPSVTGYFGVVYTLYIALFVCPIILYAAASSLGNPGEATLRRVSTLLKIDMPIGIFAVLAGFQGW